MSYHYNSHELDAKAMRAILTELFVKTFDTKKKQKENPHHHYEGTFVEAANIDKPPAQYSSDVKKESENIPTDDLTETLGRINNENKGQRNRKELDKEPTSGEVFQDVLGKINSMGHRGKKIDPEEVDGRNREEGTRR